MSNVPFNFLPTPSILSISASVLFYIAATNTSRRLSHRRPSPSLQVDLAAAALISTSKMKDSFANELYSESLRLSNNLALDPISTSASPTPQTVHLNDGGEPQCGEEEEEDEGSLWGDSDEEPASDLDREWQRRHDQFHTIGYREGLLVGKEASEQEGRNIGFKKSVISGYKWGLVRGISSALACLPDDLRDELIEVPEKRDKFHQLFESVHSLSTVDAFKLFHNDVVAKRPIGNDESNSRDITLQEQRQDDSPLDNYFNELQSLLVESPSISVHLVVDE
ncbi:hypothetical protein ACFE04_021216 [Oxalis oulophora]